MSPLAVLGILLGYLAIGMPIFLSLGFLSLMLFWQEGMPLVSLPQLFVDHLNSITLIAIPFFVMAAAFMERGGVAKALIDCAQAWIGSARGGLALVCVVATTVFSAICGSSVATALAMGRVLAPAMTERGYEQHFALGVIGASGTLGILIPPSLAMIVFAVIAEESVPKLFLAGVIPGLMQAGLFTLYIIIYCRIKQYPKEPRVTARQFTRINLRAIPALMVPGIILGGVYSGIVTVTEVAGVAALVAIMASLFIYRGVTLPKIPSIIAGSLKTTASIVFIILGALAFGHWITDAEIAEDLVHFVVALELKTWQFLLFMNLLMLVLGMFLEVYSVILITLPVVLPLLEPLGIDPIHYAIIVTVNMELALLSPPIGLNLYVMSSISGAKIATVIKGVAPFILLMLMQLLLITYIPDISLWLPNLVYGK